MCQLLCVLHVNTVMENIQGTEHAGWQVLVLSPDPATQDSSWTRYEVPDCHTASCHLEPSTEITARSFHESSNSPHQQGAAV